MESNLKTATNLKSKRERQVLKLRSMERSLSEELHSVKSDIEHLTEQLEDLKDQIHETCFKVSRIETYKSTENIKMESRLTCLEKHKQAFDEIFEKGSIFTLGRTLLQLRNKELKQKELEEEEKELQKRNKIVEQNELHAKMVSTVEEEIKAIERECTVLKKRNNAIMLKLRRKLMETENERKELLKKREDS
ncbi:uncharacterized protein LOC113230861 [Hyposmocoma kahamanoa]|uniref:uncharacterized protein LOC113230861 n=1 Tax=Hyposmocoma kahamanoa TaxID=1477025 RepID=UPI000E6D92D3|nr:uncharacterized protein LOC113230861 [Hyposmocoma kahamanoa]